MTQWFLEESTLEAMRAAWPMSADNIAAASALIEARGEDDVMNVAGGTAYIDVQGVLAKKRDFWAVLFGYGSTAYPDVIDAIQRAEVDPRVKDIQLNIDSPGGSVDGMFDAVAAIRSAEKPTRAYVGGMAASAAYALASQADEIVASSEATQIGSIGVVASFYVNDNRIDITSTEAPNKRPNVMTEEGQAVIRTQLDEMHELFVEGIATGRSTTPDTVNASYGRGGVMLARAAKKRGMIDAIASKDKGTTSVDLNKLKAEYPQVFEQAKAEGRQEGVSAERDRVKAHLTLAKGSNAWELAATHILEGSDLTAEISAAHMEAVRKNVAVEARQDDDKLADVKAAKPSLHGEADAVAALVEAQMGVQADA